MPRIEALDHIAIATANLEESLAFWQAQLGLVCEHVEELPERGIRVAFLPVGGTRIELVSPLPGHEETSEVSKFLRERGGGIHHIALRTPDVDADIKAMADGGARIAQQPSPGAHECRVAFVHPKSTGGVLLELSTPNTDLVAPRPVDLHGSRGHGALMSQYVSDAVARVAQQVASGGRSPVVVFDLDGTLFDNGPRTWQILVDFAEHEGNAALRRTLDKAPRTRLPYLLKETLHSLGVSDAGIAARAQQFWMDRFFTDDQQSHDIPIAGALALVRSLYEKGATIVYLSGRDVPNMLVGVCLSLRAHGFPVGLSRTVTVLKPSFHDDDLTFKKSALAFIETLGEVVATYDNEPANCNAFCERWPEALHIFVDTQHAPNPPPLHASVVTVDDLTS